MNSGTAPDDKNTSQVPKTVSTSQENSIQRPAGSDPAVSGNKHQDFSEAGAGGQPSPTTASSLSNAVSGQGYLRTDTPPASPGEVPSTAAPLPGAGKSPPATLVILAGLLLLVLGIRFGLSWLTLIGSLISLALSWGLIWPSLQGILAALSVRQRSLLVALPAFLMGVYGLMQATGIIRAIRGWGQTVRWDIVGSLGDFLGAFGQILVALLALYVAWRQYIISRDLTVQQNRITQQQTIDAYFQGISDLVLDDEGLLEDWPQERIIAEARTSAILSSIDAPGKAKVIRFLSRSKLLTPLRRDRHLGRPMLDGSGGYAEDRQQGLRVIDLGAMLANADLANSDLRWTDLSDVNLIRANLAQCDLVRTNFSRAVLYQATLAGADIVGARFFYGSWETASPRSRTEPPNFTTGEYTGAVVEDADFSGVKRMSEEQRHYCCRWGGVKTRATIPGGCEGIPSSLAP